MLESAYKRRGQWQLGSLTHALNAEASGYVSLPEFPKEAPDRSVRDLEDSWGKEATRSKRTNRSGESEAFYDSEDDSSSGSDFYSSISGSDDSGTDDSDSDSDEGTQYTHIHTYMHIYTYTHMHTAHIHYMHTLTYICLPT